MSTNRVRANGKAVWNWFDRDPYNMIGDQVRLDYRRCYPIETVRVGDDYQSFEGIINRLTRAI